MIVLNVLYRCKPGMRDKFLDRLVSEGIDKTSQAEDGNLRYHYYLPVDGGDELLLMEKWRDADALRAHSLQPHFTCLKEIKDEYVLDTVIERFDAAD
ncbi:MAG: antibiotic biosynthesis monooxygenase [Clostridia bacterium]|nr:antibiotic biosynthesis monooxygenase [Clostridia bacterium]